MKRLFACLVCLSAAAPALAERTPPRRIAVAQFDAPSDSRARMEVLTTLSDHADVEVVSLEDIAFAAKRLKADPEGAANFRFAQEKRFILSEERTFLQALPPAGP